MRTQTNRLIDMMDQGLISAAAVAEMALAHMSEDDVADMMRSNDIIEDEDDEDEENIDIDLDGGLSAFNE